MSETLEQIALRVAGEAGLDRPQEFLACVKQVVSALGAQEPVAWHYATSGSNSFLSYSGPAEGFLTGGQPLYAAPVVNPDWQMVPKEPTPEMLNALKDGFYEEDFEQDKAFTVFDAIKAEYKAMLAAAPEYGK